MKEIDLPSLPCFLNVQNGFIGSKTWEDSCALHGDNGVHGS